MEYEGRVNAPEIPEGALWLNSTDRLRLQDLRGRLLVLEFWAAGCVHCIHLHPVLSQLESRYADELTVIAVHSPKFDAERDPGHVLHAIQRYGIAHPVVNDPDMEIWRSYNVRAWPTLVFVDPNGKVIGRHEGEMQFPAAAQLIEEMLAIYRSSGALVARSLPITRAAQARSTLSYPGKVLVDSESDRLFIADSGHNRLLVTTLDGEIQSIIGSGNDGIRDGVMEQAEFAGPQGIAVRGETLFVADTQNHAIRAVDLEVGIVETIAGNGIRGVGRIEGGEGLSVSLRSPWDITLVGQDLFIAMAGCHQIWKLGLGDRVVQAIVGTGEENIVDGPPEQALLAQPSGITSDEEGVLYFTDPEASAVRSADLKSMHEVNSLVGDGLFNFGCIDGPHTIAKLQHPMGIDVDGDFAYITDTYNNKVRRIGLDTWHVSTVAGTGIPAWTDGPLGDSAFYAPTGLSVSGDEIYVADTNNHMIRVIDMKKGIVRTLDVDF